MEEINLQGNGCRAIFKVKDGESEGLKGAIRNSKTIYNVKESHSIPANDQR